MESIKEPRPAGRLLSLPAGALLFICAFLPAVRGCEKAPVYPYQEVTRAASGVPFGAPHLFAILCIVAALVFAKDQRRPASPGVTIFWAITMMMALPFGYTLTQGLRDARTMSWFICAGTLMPYLWLLYKLARGRNPADEAAWTGRVIWTGATICALWYTFLMVSLRSMYGVWLSLFSALMLAVSGVLIEKGSSDPNPRD